MGSATWGCSLQRAGSQTLAHGAAPPCVHAVPPRPSRCDARYGYHEVLHLTTLVGNLVGLVLDCWDLATPLPPPPTDTSAAALLSDTLRTTAASIATYFVDDAVAA